MANDISVDFVTPVMRIVQGDVAVPQTKDTKGNPLVVKTGANKGQPTQRFFIACAVEKFVKDQAGNMIANPEFAELYAKFYNVARQGYPNCFDAAGNITHPRLTLKIMDGDGKDNDGKPNSGKPGFAGCWVIKFSSSFAPRLIDRDGNVITDPNLIKRGYYVRVFGNISPNTGSDVPGIYVNHNGIQLVGYGQEISTGPDIAALAKAAPISGYMPAGMSTAPTAPAGGLPPLPGAGAAPQMPGMVAPQMPALPGMAAPAPAAAPQLPSLPGMAAPGAQMAPAPQMLPPGAVPLPGTGAAPQMPQMPGMTAPTPAVALPPLPVAAPVAPPAPQYQMTAAAQGFTREQYHAQGHTDETLLAHGLMVAAPATPAALPRNDGFVAAVLAPPAPQYQMTAAAQGFTREQYHAQGHTDETLLAHGLMARVG